ncbi:MAG: DUF5348 domain-containing protein [Ktedonobacteraceae bacterium]|jgi:hypothetical protein|nr:DUF5348 domain-containing protein [Ktedonobacteraceae bacterium]
MEETEHLQQQTQFVSSTLRYEEGQQASPFPPSRSRFLLAGRSVSEGDRLAIRVMNSWVEGEVRHDQSGWYVLTAAQVGIRLSAGLTARWQQP